MIPITRREHDLLIGFLTEFVRAEVEANAQFESSDRYKNAAFLLDRLQNQWIVYDRDPNCSVMVSDDNQCSNKGHYQPVIYGMANGQPVTQMPIPIRVCSEHAGNNVDRYLTDENWQDMSKQIHTQTGLLLMKADARLFYIDHTTGETVPPPGS